MNVCQLMGRLTRDPELKITPNGIPVSSFSIAVDRRKGKDGRQETDFFNCIAWRGTGEHVAKWFQKGQRIALTGTIQNREYEDKDCIRRRITEIIVDNVFFADSKKDTQGDNNQNQGYGQNYTGGYSQGAGGSYGQNNTGSYNQGAGGGYGQNNTGSYSQATRGSYGQSAPPEQTDKNNGEPQGGFTNAPALTPEEEANLPF